MKREDVMKMLVEIHAELYHQIMDNGDWQHVVELIEAKMREVNNGKNAGR